MTIDLAPYEVRGDLDAETPPTPAERRRQQDAERIAAAARAAAEQAPPIPPSTLARVAAIFGREVPLSDLMRWRLRLYCGHIVERQAHRDHTRIEAAFTLSACKKCGLDPATIVAAKPLGLAAPPPEPTEPPDTKAARLRAEREMLRRRLAEIDGLLSKP